MLAAEAIRLAAIEALCPTACLISGSGFPTLAGDRVFDSRAAGVKDLDDTARYTPVIAVYTLESGTSLRGAHADASDSEADAVIDIVAELAVGIVDGEDAYVDAMASDDAAARLVLGALLGQVRYVLDQSAAGIPFRRICKRIVRQENKTFAVPELGLRYQRVTMRLHCEIRDDDFDVPVGQLPEPMHTLLQSLPAQSYAREKLEALAAHFNPDQHEALGGIAVESGPVSHGL